MHIDKVFILNLEHRTDRKEKMTQIMQKANISNYEFFKAIKPTEDELLKWNKNYCRGLNIKYKLGQLGCCKSHIEVYKIALERQYTNILVLEDDCEFVDDFNKIHEYSSQINDDYDMLYFSGSHIIKPQKVTKNINKLFKTYTTHGYFIKPNMMKYIIENVNGCDCEFDVFLGDLQKTFKCYCVTPRMAIQTPGFSDIQQVNVNYTSIV